MKSHMKLWVFAILASIVSQNFQSSTGLTIDKNGGYHVVLAIKNDEAKPTLVDTYINSIKQSFRTLSGKMWIATQESFYIAKLDIILPQSWEVEGNLTLVSYPTADIRVSSANKFPYVENNNLCDLPGDFIELPKNLFDNEDTGDLGDNWKVLLVSWARYRWGAYEEHGAPGDKQFPYFVRDVAAVDDEPKWVPNGCTNGDDKLVGAYKNLDGTPCDPTSTSDLDLTCRFYPDKRANVNVTSSLMHFHFMDSVYEFCNATTHKKNVPTKQNVYCDNKSVMETIESSPDFKAIENKNTYVPELQAEVSVSASKPPLYILLDNGLADNNGASVLNQVIPILGKFFNDIDTTGDHKELIVGVGEFPTEETQQYLKPLVPLGLLSQNKDAVVNAIGNRNAVNLSGADFGVALQQAAAIIKASSAVDGGNILFVKTSGAKNITDFSTEKEIELTLRRDNIKLFTLEIVDMAKTRQNLVKIATETQGDAIAYSRADRSKIPTEFREWLEKLLAEYSSPPTPKRVERIAYSGIVSANNVYTIPVWSGTQTLTFMLATVSKIVPSQVFAGIDTSQVVIRANFVEDTEFNNTRYVYIGSLNTVGWDLKEVVFRFPGGRSHLTVLSDGANLGADISVSVQTTAVNGTIDLGNIPNPDAPFVISARITQNNRPVIGARVVALVYVDGVIDGEIVLRDDPYGLGTSEGDGTYSEVYIPRTDGIYTITVRVSKMPGTATAATTLSVSSLFIPHNQDYGIFEPVPFPSGATKLARLESSIHVKNAGSYATSIQSIRDLTFSVAEINPALVQFQFTNPRILQLGNTDSGPDVQRVYETENPDLFNNLDVNNLPGGVNEALRLQWRRSSGVRIALNHTRTKLDVPLYFVAVSFEGTITSRLSNIVMLAPRDGENPFPNTEKPDTPSSNPPEVPEELSKPWIKSTGGIITVVVIVLVCFAAAGVGY